MFLDIPHIAYMYPTHVLQDRAAQLFASITRSTRIIQQLLPPYRLELAFSNNYVPRKYQSYKWHLSMLLRYQMAGGSMPGFDSGKIETYCKPIDKALERAERQEHRPSLTP